MVRLQGDFAKPPEKRFGYKNCFDALFRVRFFLLPFSGFVLFLLFLLFTSLLPLPVPLPSYLYSISHLPFPSVRLLTPSPFTLICPGNMNAQREGNTWSRGG